MFCCLLFPVHCSTATCSNHHEAVITAIVVTMSMLMTVHSSFFSFWLFHLTESMRLKEATRQRRHLGALPPPPPPPSSKSHRLTWTTDLRGQDQHHQQYNHHHPPPPHKQLDYQLISCSQPSPPLPLSSSPPSSSLSLSDQSDHNHRQQHPQMMPTFRRRVASLQWAPLLLLSSLLLCLLCTSCLAQYRPNWPSPFLQREIFVLNLEDGYFGCQVNESTDFLQLFELSKLCDGAPQCFQGSDEVVPELKCIDRSKFSLFVNNFCIFMSTFFFQTSAIQRCPSAQTESVWTTCATAMTDLAEKAVIYLVSDYLSFIFTAASPHFQTTLPL